MKDRSVGENCYYETSKDNINKNTLIQNKQPKIEKVKNKNNNRHLIIGFSNCGKTYIMSCNLLQKQEILYINIKSLNQYLDIKAQTSDQKQPLGTYENSTVVFGWYVALKTSKQYWSVFYKRAS